MLDEHCDAERTIFVGNLGSSVKEEILFELFLQAGPLKRVTIARDKEGRQKSYGFVCYKHRETVPYAIALLNGTWLYGRPIRLQNRSGSLHGDGGGAGPPGAGSGTCSPQQTNSALASFPESSALLLSGFPTHSHFQNQLLWNMVSGQGSQYSPTTPCFQYHAPPSLLGPALQHLPWPPLDFHQWPRPLLCSDQAPTPPSGGSFQDAPEELSSGRGRSSEGDKGHRRRKLHESRRRRKRRL